MFCGSAPGKHKERVKFVQKQVLDWQIHGKGRKMCTARPSWMSITQQTVTYKDSSYRVQVSRLGVPTFIKRIAGCGWMFDILNDFSQKCKKIKIAQCPLSHKFCLACLLNFVEQTSFDGVCLIKNSRRVLLLRLKN